MTSQKIQLRESVIIANRKDIMLNLVHRRINNCTMKVARVWSLQDSDQQVLVTYNTKEALDETDEWSHDGIRKINEVENNLHHPDNKRCYSGCPCSHTEFKKQECLFPCVIKTLVAKVESVCLVNLQCLVGLFQCLCLSWIFVMSAMILWGMSTISFSLLQG